MGTDVYLVWDKITKKEKKDQITGFSIDNGRNGYLRASIGMRKENTVLRILFPHHLWESTNDYEVFDFQANVQKSYQLGLAYLISEIFNLPFQVNEEAEAYAQWGNNLALMLAKTFKADQIDQGKIENRRYAVMWVESLWAFMELGAAKQKAGKNPKMHISW